MNPTRISWTDFSWNPITGCSHVSRACDGCYAEALSLRRGWSLKPWTTENAAENVILHPERLGQPGKHREPKKVFVCSMSDLFHAEVPDAYLQRVFDTMRACPQHTFQTLTKRPERMAAWKDWPANVWAGTTVEDCKQVWRLDVLRMVPAAVRWVSVEPLFEDLGDLNLAGVQWVVVGGYSGRDYRENPMHHVWARNVRDACQAQGVAFYFKQSSGARSGMGTALYEADGSRQEWHEFPG